jgi:ketosteroid isomerase-like protein
VTDDKRIELIRTGFESWEAGEIEAALALFHPEVEVFAPPEIGNPGTFHGTEGFLEWSKGWFEVWESFQQDLISIELVGAKHALARVKQTGLGKGSGIRVEREATYVYEIEDERLIYMALFFDHDKASSLAREREAPLDSDA